MRLCAVLALGLGLATTATAQQPTWTYQGRTGPLNWGKLEPASRACADGHAQSPIDIRGARLNTALEPLKFHFLTGPVTLENTGNTIVAHIRPGGTFVGEGVTYQLEQLVFHHPSEHAVKGTLTDMDVDLMFHSNDGKQAAISVRLAVEQGTANAAIATLWEHLPSTPGARAEITDTLNAGGLLPADRSFWAYTGSLTVPPCTEGVRWYVMEQPVSISREQLRQFVAIFRIASRPLQDRNGRKIEAQE